MQTRSCEVQSTAYLQARRERQYTSARSTINDISQKVTWGSHPRCSLLPLFKDFFRPPPFEFSELTLPGAAQVLGYFHQGGCGRIYSYTHRSQGGVVLSVTIEASDASMLVIHCPMPRSKPQPPPLLAQRNDHPFPGFTFENQFFHNLSEESYQGFHGLGIPIWAMSLFAYSTSSFETPPPGKAQNSGKTGTSGCLSPMSILIEPGFPRVRIALDALLGGRTARRS